MNFANSVLYSYGNWLICFSFCFCFSQICLFWTRGCTVTDVMIFPSIPLPFLHSDAFPVMALSHAHL